MMNLFNLFKKRSYKDLKPKPMPLESHAEQIACVAFFLSEISTEFIELQHLKNFLENF